MLIDSFRQVVGYTNIKGTIFLVCHHVDIILFHSVLVIDSRLRGNDESILYNSSSYWLLSQPKVRFVHNIFAMVINIKKKRNYSLSKLFPGFEIDSDKGHGYILTNVSQGIFLSSSGY